MKLIAYCAVYNEIEYIEYAIRSIIDHVDRYIIIEGCWKETAVSNGKIRSDDGTIQILEKLQKEYPDKIEIHKLNGNTQLEQRTFIFDFIKEDCWMFLQDGDEVYSKEEIQKIKAFINSPECKMDCIAIRSNTFINDFFHYVPFDFPRLFRINKDKKYRFIAPNVLSCDNKPIPIAKINGLTHHHYSYVKSKERFIEKKRERVLLHGKFEWELNGDIIRREGVDILEYTGEHPEIMKSHPMWGIKKHEDKPAAEIICFMQHSGIGNLIHTIPCLKAIRQIKPEANIYVLTWDRSARILDGADFINLVVSKDNIKFLQSLKRKVDHMIISPVGTLHKELGDYCKNIMTHAITPPWSKHEVEVNMDFARRLGYKGETPSNEIVLFDYNVENANKALEAFGIKDKFIIINGSYLKEGFWHYKHLGNDKYSLLLKNIAEKYKDYCVLFLGTNEDAIDAEDIIVKSGQIGNDKIINGCGFSSDIKDVAAVIKKSSLVVGNDGALAHLAAALQVPTVTMFTFTNIIKNMPLNKKGKIVAVPCNKRIMCQHNTDKLNECCNNGCFNIPIDNIMNAIKEIIDV